MNSASVADIKRELKHLEKEELIELVLRLTKYKKENKELLSYVLFEIEDDASFLRDMKAYIDSLFDDIHASQLYLAKKTYRKIIRHTQKWIKYAGKPSIEIELWLHVCERMKEGPWPLMPHPVLLNMYLRLQDKVAKAFGQLHEDVQFEYRERLVSIEL